MKRIFAFVLLSIALILGSCGGSVTVTPNPESGQPILSEISSGILGNMKNEIEIVGFWDSKTQKSIGYSLVDRLMGGYAQYPNIKIKYVDPKNAEAIKQLDPDNAYHIQNGDFIVKCGSRIRKLGYGDLFLTRDDPKNKTVTMTGVCAEQSFTAAINFVASVNTPTVYFTSGHQEIQFKNEYANVVSFLEGKNLAVEMLDLASADTVPPNAVALLVVSPQSDLSAPEKDKVTQYLKSGGKAVFMFDYLEKDPDFEQFNALLGGYGVTLNHDVVRETDPAKYEGNEYVTYLNVRNNAVVTGIYKIVLAYSRSIGVLKNEKENITVTPLLSTSETAVGKSLRKGNEDTKGPLDVAVVIEDQSNEKPARILVIGNAIFATDSAQEVFGKSYSENLSFFMQSLNWVIHYSDPIKIDPINLEK